MPAGAFSDRGRAARADRPVNTLAFGLAISLSLALLAGLAALVTSVRWRAATVGVLTGLSGVTGVFVAALAVTGTTWRADLPQVLPLAGISLAVDPLSGWFLLIVSAVTALTGLYTTGYAGRTGQGSSSRTAMAVLPGFCAAMMLVPLAASVTTFLLTWELMA